MATSILLGVLALAVPQSSPTAVQAPIVAASLFKNGFSVVTREIKVPGPGLYTLSPLPQSSYGTLWFSTSRGTQIADLVSTTVIRSTSVGLGSFLELLTQNKGKTVTLTLKTGNREVTGAVQAVNGSLVLLRQANGVGAYSIPEIVDLRFVDPNITDQATTQSAERVLRFRITGTGASTITMFSLERGISWVPAYAVDVSDPGELTLLSRATIVNDLADLNGAETQLVTGFPNLIYANLIEPLLQQGPVALANLPGGFGGGGLQTQAITTNAMRAAPSMADMAEAMPIGEAGAGDQREDLFFYRKPDVTLNRGDRGQYLLFSTKAKYDTVYTWDIGDTTLNGIEYRELPAGPQTVWHTVQFPNSSGQPLTTGAVTILSGGEIVGQDTLNYTSNRATTEIRINKALDVVAEGFEEELGRDLGAVKYANGTPMYDLVRLRGTLAITNRKAKAVAMRITRELTGEVIEAKDGKVTKTARGLRQVNPGSRIEWKPSIEPGKSVTLTYEYRIYVRSG